MALDGVGNVAEVIAGARLLEPEHQAFVGDVDQLPRFQRDVADQIHAARVAVPAVDDRGHVDVDDIAVLQRLLARNAVADDMIDRDAAALGIAAIAQGCGGGASLDRHLVDDVVEILGGHAGDDVGHQRVENFRGQPTGPAHARKTLGAVQLDHAVAGLDPVVAGDGDILSHQRLNRRMAASRQVNPPAAPAISQHRSLDHPRISECGCPGQCRPDRRGHQAVAMTAKLPTAD